MISNFDFLKDILPELYTNTVKAEKNVYTDVITSAIFARRAMEYAVYEIYTNEGLDIPYNTAIGNMIKELGYEAEIPRSLLNGMDIIRRTGNIATHRSNRRLSQEDALVAVEQLFQICYYIVRSYEDNPPKISAFDSALLKQETEAERTRKQLEELKAFAAKASDKQEQELKKLRLQLLHSQQKQEEYRLQAEELVQRRAERTEQGGNIPTPIRTEAETRTHLIDLLLAEAGWDDLQEGRDLEYKVTGLPSTPTGNGYVDYVLWGDNGKPLAIVEAKKTGTSPENGQHQAKEYADALEKQFGQRPIIFYSNGYHTYIWDDSFYPPRKVSGFYTKDELKTHILRRTTRKDLGDYVVNNDITNRHYQKEAISRLIESLQYTNDNNQLIGKKREALLVMATGSGKTRTSCSIVDMMTKSNWAKRILFLADRNALVSQAKDAFQEHLPHLSAIDLTEEKEDNTTRLVFSTYPTMLNQINKAFEDGKRLYSVGHFDLIIIDEAHRSVYQKYKAIFEYFDSLLLGLTATPKTDIDHNTYELFNISDNDPTFAYELDQAIEDKYLVPYKTDTTTTKFLEEGIVYEELSEEDKAQFETLFGDPNEEDFEHTIDSAKINSFLFNTNTVDEVLNNLMEKGIKVNGGNKLGKTIIFAKNHNHALFIQERFNIIYPEYTGTFLQVIDNQTVRAKELIKAFCDDKKELGAQIAVSVDMMDTGVDAPRVVNLVFFKKVRSKSKFWQMIGRGTRLRPDLFGPGMHKEYFLIFDVMGNFEWFNENPNGIETRRSFSTTQILFKEKLAIVRLITLLQDATQEDTDFATKLCDQMHSAIGRLNEQNIEVRKHWENVKKLKDRDQWNMLDEAMIQTIVRDISALTSTPEDNDNVIRFDILMYKIIHATYIEASSSVREIERVIKIARALEVKQNIPAIKAKINTIIEIQSDDFWEKPRLKDLERVREEIRDLINYLNKIQIQPLFTSFEDERIIGTAEPEPVYGRPTSLKPYKERVEAFIKDRRDHLVIYKIYNNEEVTPDEFQQLENFLIKEVLETKDKYEKEFNHQPLGKFVRSIIGVNQEVLNELFSDFITDENLSANQITFVKQIIQYIKDNGHLDIKKLTQPPFTRAHQDGVLGIFRDREKQQKLVKLIKVIDENANIG